MANQNTDRIKEAVGEAINTRFGYQNTDDYGDYILVFNVDEASFREAFKNTNPESGNPLMATYESQMENTGLRVELEYEGDKPKIVVEAVDIRDHKSVLADEVTPVVQYHIDDAKFFAESASQRLRMIDALKTMYGDTLMVHESDPFHLKATVPFVPDDVLKGAGCRSSIWVKTATGERTVHFGSGVRETALDVNVDFRKGQVPTSLIDPMDKEGYPLEPDEIPAWFDRLYKKTEENLAYSIGLDRLRHDIVAGYCETEKRFVLVDVPQSEFNEDSGYEFTDIDYNERALVDRYDPFKVHVKFDAKGEIAFNKMGRKSDGRGIIRDNEFLESWEFTYADRKNLRNEMAFSFFFKYRDEIEKVVRTAIRENRIPDHPNRKKGKRYAGAAKLLRPPKLPHPGQSEPRVSRGMKM